MNKVSRVLGWEGKGAEEVAPSVNRLLSELGDPSSDAQHCGKLEIAVLSYTPGVGGQREGNPWGLLTIQSDKLIRFRSTETA